VSDVNIMDASAILAYLNEEKGQQVVEDAIDAAPSWITTVNYCEVVGILCRTGMPEAEAAGALDALGLLLIHFDRELAIRSGGMRVRTAPIGASLGDRACLALAEVTAASSSKVTVYTAERAWMKIKWSFKVVLIR
jgi:PIN domain nuclease of toxin-antitoxin system